MDHELIRRKYSGRNDAVTVWSAAYSLRPGAKTSFILLFERFLVRLRYLHLATSKKLRGSNHCGHIRFVKIHVI